MKLRTTAPRIGRNSLKIDIRYAYCSWLGDPYSAYGEFTLEGRRKGVIAISGRSFEDAKNELIETARRSIHRYLERNVSKDIDTPNSETIEIEVPGLEK